MDLLQVTGLDFAYPGQEGLQLSGVNLALRQGHITGIMGPNGSGKSTLLACLSGDQEVTRGQVLYQGQPLTSLEAKARAQEIAVVKQSYQAKTLLTVEEVVSMGRTPYRRPFRSLQAADQERVQEAMDRIGITPLRYRPLAHLSGGQKQLVWLALALAQDPKLLLLDEPTAALDIYNQKAFLELIRTLNQDQGLTVCIILHDLNQLLRYCDYVYVLKEGRLVLSGHPEVVIDEANIQQIYGVDSERLVNSRHQALIDLY